VNETAPGNESQAAGCVAQVNP